MIRTDALNSFVSSAATRRGRERLSLANIPSSAYSFIDFTKANNPSLVSTVGTNRGSVNLFRNPTSNSGREPGVINRTGRLYFPTSGEARYEYVNGSCVGLRLGSGATNYLANTLTFGTSGQTWNWVQTNMTGAGTLNAIGPDGATSAVTLTATGANATILQNRGALGVVGTRRFSVWLRQVSGSGDIELTYNPAGGYTKVTPTSSWTRFSISAASGAANSGIRIASGIVIEAAFPMVEITTNSVPSDEVVGDAPCASYNDFLTSFPKWTPARGLTVVLSVTMSSRGNTSLASSLNFGIDDGADNFISGSFGRDPNDAFDDFGQWDAYSASYGPADTVDATQNRLNHLRKFAISIKSQIGVVAENGSGQEVVVSSEFPWNSDMSFYLNGNHVSIQSLMFIDRFVDVAGLEKLTL